MKNSFAIAALSLFNSAAAESDAIVPNFVMFGVIFTLHRHHKQTFKEKLLPYVPTDSNILPPLTQIGKALIVYACYFLLVI